MILKIQILSLLFSFGYGNIFFWLLELNYKLLYEGKIIYRIITSFLFVITISLMYFIGLLKINNGILHIYFFACLLTGYMSSFVIYKKINCKKNSLCYNVNVGRWKKWLRRRVKKSK